MSIEQKPGLVAAVKDFQQGYFREALEACRALREEDESDPRVWNIGALSAYQLQDYTTAVDWMRGCIERQDHAEHWYNLGMFYFYLGDSLESMKAHQECVKRDENHVKALINLGNYFGRAGYLRESITCFNRARELDPTNSVLLNNYANILKDCGLLTEASALYTQALSQQPMAGCASNLCYISQFKVGVNLAQLSEIHQQWGKQYADPYKLSWPQHSNLVDPSRRLRVGFLSEDFRYHTVGNYLLPVFERLDLSFDKYCYYLKSQEDSVTARFREAADQFRVVNGKSDTELFNLIKQDEIDVLFELSGHTSGQRLQLIARKPAPVQLSWLGYVGTLGLEAIDAVVGSHWTMPIGVEKYFVEDIARVAPGYAHQCYSPPFSEPISISECPSKSKGYVTFGNISTLAKLNDEVLSVWGRIVRQCENSRLVIRAASVRSEQIQGRLLQRLNLPADRVTFYPSAAQQESMQTYNEIDVALDTWPFSGCTTTCETLYMGVPLVTYPHQTEASRHSLAFAQAAGLSEFVALSVEEYVAKALWLAESEEVRAHYRSTLRESFLASKACDVDGFAHEISTIIRDKWRDWCGSRSETAAGA